MLLLWLWTSFAYSTLWNRRPRNVFHSLHSQELSSLGFPPIFRNQDGIRDLDAVVALNNIYDLLQLHRQTVGMMEDLEVDQLKSSSDLHYQHLTNSRLKVSHTVLYISSLYVVLCMFMSNINFVAFWILHGKSSMFCRINSNFPKKKTCACMRESANWKQIWRLCKTA